MTSGWVSGVDGSGWEWMGWGMEWVRICWDEMLPSVSKPNVQDRQLRALCDRSIADDIWRHIHIPNRNERCASTMAHEMFLVSELSCVQVDEVDPRHAMVRASSPAPRCGVVPHSTGHPCDALYPSLRSWGLRWRLRGSVTVRVPLRGRTSPVPGTTLGRC